MSAIELRPMLQADLGAADRVMRLAFGTEFGLPDPMQFRGDAGLVENRFRTYPDGCVIAEHDARVIGLGIASRWGSVGVLGPICVLPDYWNRGTARQLVAWTVARMEAWGCRACGLFTNPASPRHLRLYQQFGFWPRSLTLVMARLAQAGAAPAYERLATTTRPRGRVLADAAALCDQAFAGLDVGSEIHAAAEHGYGDTLLLYEGERLNGFAVCHHGAGSEAGSQALYVKFAAAPRGPAGHGVLKGLLDACAHRAHQLGVKRVVTGVNTARHGAYRLMLAEGFRSEFHGVRMHRPHVDVYDDEDCFVLDDWR